MEMLKNKIEPIIKNNKNAENTAVKLRVINSSLGTAKTAPVVDSLSDGDVWELNLILGIGNDIY